MAANDWSRWYREGTVNVTNGSKVVVGTDTFWASASIKAGDIFSLDGVTDYEVSAVTDNTHLTLATVYTGTSANGAAYFVNRAFSATTGAEVAAQTAELVSDMARYIDKDQATIHGKSAYEIAKTNGYVGTESQWLASLIGKSAYEIAAANGYTGTQTEWLEYLIGAGQWSAMDERTKFLTTLDGRTHNSFLRGRNLGSSVSAEQWAAIKSGTYDDMYINDYWVINGHQYMIRHFYYHDHGVSGEMLDAATGEMRKMNGGAGAGYQPHIMMTYQFFVPDEFPALSCYSYYDAEEDKNEDGSWAGYTSTNFYRNIRPLVLKRLEEDFGADHLYEWETMVPSKLNAEGVPVWGLNLIMKCELITHEMLRGQRFVPFFGSKYGTVCPSASSEMERGQLAGFRFAPVANSTLGFPTRDVFGLWNGHPVCGYLYNTGNDATALECLAVVFALWSR